MHYSRTQLGERQLLDLRSMKLKFSAGCTDCLEADVAVMWVQIASGGKPI